MGRVPINGLPGEGTRGAINDGLTQDFGKNTEMGFLVFASGIRPISSSRSCRVIGTRCQIECGDVLVNQGDLIFGDMDEVVVIPRGSADEVVRGTLEKVQR